MDGFIIFLIICAVFFTMDYFISKKFEDIANLKGHEGYFWWCFWLGLLGWIMVAALPDNREHDTTKIVYVPKTEEKLPVNNLEEELPDL
jgi:hypothetical protein